MNTPQKRTVELQHLSPDFIKSLDIMFGQLITANTGYADWRLEIRGGKITRFSSTQHFQPDKLKLA